MSEMKWSVIGKKIGGAGLEVLAALPTKEAASEFSLGVDMSRYDDVWIETIEPKKTGNALLPATPTDRTSLGLRDALFDEIDAFRKGHGDPQRAVAISKLAGQILASAKIEHEVAKYKGSDGYAATPMQLGRRAGDEG